MIDREHDEFNWKLIKNWVGIAIISGLWWWSVFSKGIGVTMVWTVVVVALCALWFTIRDNRV
tara:strand:+ start:3658 stop:3843 length:186 start_codon:yes stop_codon:yes gene_type:complete